MPATLRTAHDQFQRRMHYVALFFGCHQRQDRSFNLRGRQVPLCARCMGILIGPLLLPFYLYFRNPWVAVLCMSAFLVDASTQLIGIRESNNWLRLLTGATFSASLLFLLTYGVTTCLSNIRH
ncbi:MAG: DUF2085 domain-containing protein [Ktedonobacteraceae bacterium]